MSPVPPDTPNIHSDDERDENGEISDDVYLHLPDIHIFTENANPESLEDEEGYHTDDNMSELEDDELEESLKKQKEGDVEPVRDVDTVTGDMFCTLMRDVSEKEWDKAESNRSLGYGNKSSDRAGRWRRQKKRERKKKEAESRKSSVNQRKCRAGLITHLYYPELLPS